jgi:hypothetical protein
MSLLYSVLKIVVRKAVKESDRQEETYEDFVRISHQIQAKFKLKLPRKRGYDFKVINIDGFQVIVGHKTGANAKKHSYTWWAAECGGGRCPAKSPCSAI